MRAEDVGRHQVGRELHALEVEVENLRESADERGLAESGESFQKYMPAREDPGEHETVELRPTEEHAVERGKGGVEIAFHGRDVVWTEKRHGVFLSMSKNLFTVPR